MTKTVTKWFLFLSVILLCIVLTAVSTEPEETTAAAGGGYVLSVYDGRIAVFATNEAAPLRILDKRIASLPQTEAERLKAGIAASDEEELQSLIEDYCS